MKRETIIKLCEENGLRNHLLFVEFFSKRFPNESDRIHSYCIEWIERFKTGNPRIYMDKFSLKVYEDLLLKHAW